MQQSICSHNCSPDRNAHSLVAKTSRHACTKIKHLHTGPFSLLFSILLLYIFGWWVFFYLWNHPLLSQRWTLALTWFSREPPSDKLHSLCESRMRNSGIVDIKAGVFVGHAGAKGMKGANQSGLTDSVWTVGSLAPQVAHFQVCNGGDQNRFELREERLRWSETRYCEWERKKKALHRENGE